MKRFNLRTVLGLSSLLGVASVSLPAFARSVPAFAGRARFVTDIAAFEESFGGVLNVSSGSKFYMIPQVVDSAGTTIYVSAKGDNPNQWVHCKHFVVNADGSAGAGSDWSSSSVHNGVVHQFPLSSSGVPVGGFGFVGCDVQPGATLVGINY
jgi:hypothetical protein